MFVAAELLHRKEQTHQLLTYTLSRISKARNKVGPRWENFTIASSKGRLYWDIPCHFRNNSQNIHVG